ncbi:MAG: hypothetical protein AAF581_14060 [Planctomycetota bacterium]
MRKAALRLGWLVVACSCIAPTGPYSGRVGSSELQLSSRLDSARLSTPIARSALVVVFSIADSKDLLVLTPESVVMEPPESGLHDPYYAGGPIRLRVIERSPETLEVELADGARVVLSRTGPNR